MLTEQDLRLLSNAEWLVRHWPRQIEDAGEENISELDGGCIVRMLANRLVALSQQAEAEIVRLRTPPGEGELAELVRWLRDTSSRPPLQTLQETRDFAADALLAQAALLGEVREMLGEPRHVVVPNDDGVTGSHRFYVSYPSDWVSRRDALLTKLDAAT